MGEESGDVSLWGLSGYWPWELWPASWDRGTCVLFCCCCYLWHVGPSDVWVHDRTSLAEPERRIILGHTTETWQTYSCSQGLDQRRFLSLGNHHLPYLQGHEPKPSASVWWTGRFCPGPASQLRQSGIYWKPGRRALRKPTALESAIW